MRSSAKRPGAARFFRHGVLAAACLIAPAAARAVLADESFAKGDTIESSAFGTGAAIAPAVTSRIALDWRVDPSRVRVSLGRGAEEIPLDAPFRISGNGADGWLALQWAHAGGTAAGAIRVRAGIADTVWVASHRLLARSRISHEDLHAEP